MHTAHHQRRTIAAVAPRYPFVTIWLSHRASLNRLGLGMRKFSPSPTDGAAPSLRRHRQLSAVNVTSCVEVAR